MNHLDDAQGILDMTTQGNVVVYGLYSGGKDSTCAVHLAAQRENFAGVVHVRTHTGPLSEQHSDDVITTARSYGWEVIEAEPTFTTYEMLVIKYGFPGPSQHPMMYQYLKGRALDAVKKTIRKKHPGKQIVYITGIRRAESQHRANAPDVQKIRTVYWVSPLVNWRVGDVVAYMDERGLSASTSHRSRDCLCGAYAQPGERAEIAVLYPEQEQYWQALEAMTEQARQLQAMTGEPRIQPHHCRWGHGSGDWQNEERRAEGVMTICSVCHGQLDGQGNVGVDPDIMMQAALDLAS